MKRVLNIALLLPALAILLSISGCTDELAGILNPKGIIAFQERQLMFDASALMLIVVLPVIIMSLAFVWHFREKNQTAEYMPDWSHNTTLESIWWGVPIAIILILGIMTWTTSHTLDPYRKINVTGNTMQIQVVALPWKWLFIYPEQNIATVNLLEIPQGVQVEFLLTTDNVPMSSFIVPQLGSQIYTMAGMRTRLHLVATHLGTFVGMNNQFNGDGFSDMNFETRVVGENDFQNWVKEIKSSPDQLTLDKYQEVRQPTIAAPVAAFSNVAPELFQTIIHFYHSPHHHDEMMARSN